MGEAARHHLRRTRQLIAVDTNILIYAHREDSPFFGAALRCITELAESVTPWCIPWPCLHEFLAIVTHPRIYSPPSTTAVALDQIEAWIESPGLILLSESEDYWKTLRSAVTASQVVGPRVHDARIAALCVGHGVRTLWSADRDFGRFRDIEVVNPLVDKAPSKK